MPCYMTGSAEGDARLSAEEAEGRASKATRAACEMARLLKGTALFQRLSPKTLEWVKEHAKIDRERRKEEKRERAEKELEKRARAKLTKAERRALGIWEK